MIEVHLPIAALRRPFHVLVLLAALSGSLAMAQTGVGVSPPRVELSTAPGSELTLVVTVDNPSQRAALAVNAYFNDLFLAPDGSSIYVDAGSNPRSLAPWTTVNPLTFTLQPNTKQTVSYTVTVPPDAAAGTYWSVLFFESEPSDAGDQPQGFGVTTVVRVGHIAYVTVGQPTLAGSIAGIHYDATGNAGALRITFQNSGDGLMRLDGHVEVRSLTGELERTLALEGVASFPGATHDLVAPFTEPLASGEYVVLAVLDYGEASVIAGEGQVEVP